MEYREDMSPLPLYNSQPSPPDPRFIPLCTHRELYLSCLQDLPRVPDIFDAPDCQDPTCITPSVIQVSSSADKYLHSTIPIAYAITSSCPREAVRKYFNIRRIAGALAPAALRICPRLSMNSAVVAAFCCPRTTLHYDANGRPPSDMGFARHCCARYGPAEMEVQYCAQCTEQGFYTAWGFASREHKPTSQIPHDHVEISLVTYSNIGTLGEGQADLDWVAHSYAEHELEAWREVWRGWRQGVVQDIFWRPLMRWRRCSVERERERKVVEVKAAKCDEVARWRREMFGVEGLDGVWEAVEEVTVDGRRSGNQLERGKRTRRHSVGTLVRRLWHWGDE